MCARTHTELPCAVTSSQKLETNVYIYKSAFENSQDPIMWQDAFTKDLITWHIVQRLVNNRHLCSCSCRHAPVVMLVIVFVEVAPYGKLEKTINKSIIDARQSFH